MTGPQPHRCLLSVTLALAWALSLSGQARGQASPPAPAADTVVATSTAPLDVDAQLAFLRTARIVSSRLIGKGITGAKRVTLSDGQLTHDAAFQAIADEAVGAVQKARRRGGELRFVDHYRYNLASWRLARSLGLGHMMPATIERSVGGRPGALSWWVDDVLMDEEERQKTGAVPPGGSLALSRQYGRMAVFTELVRDTDRNKGNVVFTKRWELVMLDFTRAFRLQTTLVAADALKSCDRALLAAMRGLTKNGLKDALQSSLTGGEIDALLARRDLLVAHFDTLIAARGEAAVLY